MSNKERAALKLELKTARPARLQRIKAQLEASGVSASVVVRWRSFAFAIHHIRGFGKRRRGLGRGDGGGRRDLR
jgi:hypothetical protein